MLVRSRRRLRFEHANPQTGCYQVECVSPSLLRVTVRVDGGTAQTVDCTDGSTQHSVPGFSGVITCINPARFCASPQLVTSDTANVPGVVWLSRAAVKVTNQRQGEWRRGNVHCSRPPGYPRGCV